MADQTLLQYGQQLAQTYQIPWPIFWAWIQNESGWNPNAKSGMNTNGTYDEGIAQINSANVGQPGWTSNPYDPYSSLQVAAENLHNYFIHWGGSWTNALAAYNGGNSAQGVANGLAAGYPNKVFALAQQAPNATGSGAFVGATASVGDTPAPPKPKSLWDMLTMPLQPSFWTGVAEGAGLGLLSVALITVGGIWLAINAANSPTGQTIIKTATKAAEIE
jgi:hypothetical protein